VRKKRQLLEHTAVFEMTPKGREILKRAIHCTKTDVYTDFDLFPITDYIESVLSTQRAREKCKLDTVGDILRSIETLKEEKAV
jgi:hypothetical protein